MKKFYAVCTRESSIRDSFYLFKDVQSAMKFAENLFGREWFETFADDTHEVFGYTMEDYKRFFRHRNFVDVSGEIQISMRIVYMNDCKDYMKMKIVAM